jgi:DnaD/phage-associated family protein
MKIGWVKLHRKIIENPIWTDSQKLKLWMLCLLKATHKEYKQLVGDQVVLLKPGEFVTGRDSLAYEFNKGVNKANHVSGISLFRWLSLLAEMGFLNIKKTNKFTVVSVVSWNEYQSLEQQTNNSCTSDEQQMNTNKNIKNIKNNKNISSLPDESKKDGNAPSNPLVDEDVKIIIESLIKNQIMRPTALNATVSNDIDYYLTKFQSKDEAREIILHAISESARRNAKSWSYVQKVLSTWDKEEFMNLEEIKNSNEVRIYANNSKGTKQNNGTSEQPKGNLSPSINW